MDEDISFPARPPLEVAADGSIIENEPGSADDVVGQVERLGVLDNGQSYALTLQDLAKLVEAVVKNRPEQIQNLLERNRITEDLGDLVNEEIARQNRGE